jgi:hypothetical protein
MKRKRSCEEKKTQTKPKRMKRLFCSQHLSFKFPIGSPRNHWIEEVKESLKEGHSCILDFRGEFDEMKIHGPSS